MQSIITKEAITKRKKNAQYLKQHRGAEKMTSMKGGHKNRSCREEEANGCLVYFGSRKEKVGALHYDSEAAACLGMRDEIEKAMAGLYCLRFASC